MSNRPRHGNREFRTRAGTPAPGSTLAAIVDERDPGPAAAGGGSGGDSGRLGSDPGRRNGPGWPWDAREALLLGTCGVFLLLALVVPSPLIAVITLPAALLAPGHVVLRTIGRGFAADGDPWLVWGLRVVLSLAVWTVAGAILAVTPGLDPRWLGGIAGAWLLLLVLVRWLRYEGHRRRVRGSAPVRLPRDADDADISADSGADGGADSDGTGTADEAHRAWVRNRIQPVQVVALAVFAVVAAASVGAAYLISSGGANPQPYIAVSFAQPRYSVYDDNGAVVATAVVRNSSDRALTATLSAYVDGRRSLQRQLDVPANGTAEVPLQGVRATGCWSSLRIAITGVPAALEPLPLYAYGPKTIAGGCPRSVTSPRPSAS